mmetsp:Transcript_28050/g.93176  ORF Transcript_28050/g.93176 Transcript_28050/m.93176 type:complete len:225 (-) Transcript_28050:402-1076(-)
MRGDRTAHGAGNLAAASEVLLAGSARIGSTGKSWRGTLREFRQRQRQDLALSIALTGEDQTAAITKDLKLSADLLEAGDADEIVRLVGRLVGYLAEPRRKGAKVRLHSAENGVASVNALSESFHQQQRQLRNVVLQLLGVVDERGLDTSDIGTRKLLKVPFKHTVSLLQGQSLDRLDWREQWIEFSRVALELDLRPRPQGHFMVEENRRPPPPHSERARTNGIY